MRLWPLHPRLLGRTQGYWNHPQLDRFRSLPDGVSALGHYLHGIAAEASSRGYRFDTGRISRPPASPTRAPALPVTTGQLEFETAHLRTKLRLRAPGTANALPTRLTCIHLSTLFQDPKRNGSADDPAT